MNEFSLASPRMLCEVIRKNKEWEAAFSVVSSLQNDGILSEKCKDVGSAVGFYERCVSYGESSPLLRSIASNVLRCCIVSKNAFLTRLGLYLLVYLIAMMQTCMILLLLVLKKG